MFFLIDCHEAIVVDTNVSEDARQLFKDEKIEKVHILLTHEHYDHTCGVTWLQENFNTVLYCHEKCAEAIATERGHAPRMVAFVLSQKDTEDGGHRYDDFMAEYKPYKCKADVVFKGNETIEIAGHRIKVEHTPGHTPGSCLYILDDSIVFTGDSLIQGVPTITRFPKGNNDDFLKITLPKLQAFDGEMMVMPGHGEPFMMKDNNIF